MKLVDGSEPQCTEHRAYQAGDFFLHQNDKHLDASQGPYHFRFATMRFLYVSFHTRRSSTHSPQENYIDTYDFRRGGWPERHYHRIKKEYIRCTVRVPEHAVIS